MWDLESESSLVKREDQGRQDCSRTGHGRPLLPSITWKRQLGKSSIKAGEPDIVLFSGALSLWRRVWVAVLKDIKISNRASFQSLFGNSCWTKWSVSLQLGIMRELSYAPTPYSYTPNTTISAKISLDQVS